ncbi:NUDIX hydrolase [Georgenia sunbinii]|uniref:NUDIX hydrolase n=1 Tax=Georgenia sunbinii TaxID=3117728 RepID=UPI002F26D06A
MTTEPAPPDPRPVQRPGDGWVECRCGARHWGRYGAAGLLLSTGPQPSRPTRVVLQHRARWSHFGGTWGLPGGAVDPGETAVAGALREAAEEAGIPATAVTVRATYVLDHGDWAYTTVLASAAEPVEPVVSDPESLEVAWVELDEVRHRPLLPAFEDALPTLREMVGRRLVLVVDAANTVGSRPDGWWRDRAGATARLRDELAELAVAGLPAADVGLPGGTWFPEIVLVTEGQARDVAPVPGVQVVPAPGPGDDEVLAQAWRATGGGSDDVVVITADRELRRRVEAVGAQTAGPRLVLYPIGRSSGA